MLGAKYMNKVRMNRKAIMSSGLPHRVMLNDLLDRGRDLGIDPFEEENERLSTLRLKSDDDILRAEWEAKGKQGKCPVYIPTIQSEYSMRMKNKNAYRTYGKNEQRTIKLDDYKTAEEYWEAVRNNAAKNLDEMCNRH